MMYGGVSACVRVSAAYRPCTLPAVAIIFMIDAFAFYPFRSIQTANTYWSSLLQTWLMQILLVFSELNISSYAGFLFSESLSNGFALGLHTGRMNMRALLFLCAGWSSKHLRSASSLYTSEILVRSVAVFPQMSTRKCMQGGFGPTWEIVWVKFMYIRVTHQLVK